VVNYASLVYQLPNSNPELTHPALALAQPVSPWVTLYSIDQLDMARQFPDRPSSAKICEERRQLARCFPNRQLITACPT